MNDQRLFGGVELGGTKSIAVVARGRTIVHEARWPTAAPNETLGAISAWLENATRDEPIAALGVASFGPLGLNPGRPNFGRVVNTPKVGWSGFDVRGHFAGRFAVPIGFDTDVAGAALAEGRWGAAQGCDVHVYLTVGTGVGGGVVVDGTPVHGRVHPEIGHVRVRRSPGDDFAGHCAFHGDCLEGLVSGPAIAARAGRPGREITPDDPIWQRVTDDLAELMSLLVLTLSPKRIVIGGGVMQDRPQLLSRVQARTAHLLASYVADTGLEELERLIVPPTLGADAGPWGAVALALNACRTGTHA